MPEIGKFSKNDENITKVHTGSLGEFPQPISRTIWARKRKEEEVH